VLASGIFDRAPSLAQVLAYVCEKYFDGSAQDIKEYSIAVDALGRSPEFDQKKDSIVRVQVHRLRERLAEYYAKDGASHGVHIVIPQGQYVPSFVVRESPDPVSEGIEMAPEMVDVQPIPEDDPRLPVPSGPFWKRSWVWVLATMLVIVAVASVGLSRNRATNSVPAGDVAARASAGPATNTSVRIGVGLDMPLTDGFGRTWEPDRYFTGGRIIKAKDRPIRGTRDPKLYQARREGVFSYDVPLPSGVYELRLHFAELNFGEDNLAGYGGEGSRAFGLDINGTTVLSRMDVTAEAGASTAHIKVFKDVTPDTDGILHLRFTPRVSTPFLNAIEITPGTLHKLNPIRIVTQDRAYTDSQGQEWLPDRFAIGGQMAKRPPLGTASDPEVYAGERFGNLLYLIPVPPGRYTLRLYLAERWHGPDLPAGGGVGSRLFDLHLNGVLLARDVDVFKLAGGSNRPLVETYRGLEPNPQGYLALSFVPVRLYAIISALEVLDEGK